MRRYRYYWDILDAVYSKPPKFTCEPKKIFLRDRGKKVCAFSRLVAIATTLFVATRARKRGEFF